MNESRWSAKPKVGLRRAGQGGRLPVRATRQPLIRFNPAVAFALAVAVLSAVVGMALWAGPSSAQGNEAVHGSATLQEISEESLPSAEETKEALLSAGTVPTSQPGEVETDVQVAEELPHRDLDGEEALELTKGVFGGVFEEPAGIFDELEPERFLSDNAAILPAGSVPGSDDQKKEEGAAPEPQKGLAAGQPVLIESTLPLRTENADGHEEVVDLSLQSPAGPDGELTPQNPLEELSIPARLGEGITLAGVGIEIKGAAGEVAPINVDEKYAFYPNMAENTDLIVAPTPTGVETMTDIRSAEAPQTTSYRISVPSGATLEPSRDGGAEIVQDGQVTLFVPPPTSTDAAGQPVPVKMRVSDDELAVTISPEPSTRYPVLVDPWYQIETYCLSSCGSSFAGWLGSTNVSSYQPLPFAQWDPNHYPGLDLTSGYPGPAWSSNHADWSYWVPRYASDIAQYGSPPTTWVTHMTAEGVLFLPFGNSSNYPAMVVGLIEPSTGWAPGDWVHYGGQGELSSWENVELSNPPNNPAVKGADLNLVTYEYESQAKYRDVYLGGASVYVADVDAPQILELRAPNGWVTGAAAGIAYGFEDTGLGVRAALIRVPGESAYHAGWGADFTCSGTNVSPCPRRIYSSDPKAPGLGFVPNELPTGKDQLEVKVEDPFAEPGHEASSTVTVKVDNTAPEVTLSGALAEQETKGTHLAEYPLSVKATDGTSEAPQSGIAKVEIKVDGKKIAMPGESAWAPSCQTENCAFSGSWTLKAPEYAVGPHEVEVVATDAAGNVSDSTLEIEIGEGSPQTSFTSPHPTYESHEVPAISFKATREGKPVEGATFRCSLDGTGETPTAPCTSPYKMPGHLEPKKWHVLLVQAVDKSGKADPTPARWRFQTGDYPAAPPSEKLVFPEVGKKTASYYTLEAEWGANPEGKTGQGVSGVTFEMKLPGFREQNGKEVSGTFSPVPTACVIDGQGKQISWPLSVHNNPGHSAPVYLKVRGCPVFEAAGYPEKEVLFRAVFDGGEKVAGASSPNATEFIYSKNASSVPTDAVEGVGPASVDLLTGAFTLSRTDVSIPVPGYEANLEFTRVYSSSQNIQAPGYSNILGGAWQPSSPLESEFEGQAWSRIEERVIPAKEKVMAYECWNEEGETISCPANGTFYCDPASCEEWEKEPSQPKEEWIELLDNEGDGVPFEITEGGLVAPEWAKELKLTRGGGSYVLSYPNGTHTTFVQSGTESQAYVPEYISYQATPGSMRLLYKTEGKGLRLEREIAPSPAECKDWESQVEWGCRTLIFNYEQKPLNGGEVNLLESIAYAGPDASGGTLVAAYSYSEVANPQGVRSYSLTGESDPRLANSTEVYAFAASPYSNLLTTLVPPGQQAWNFEYDYGTGGGAPRLKSVGRAGATTTIAYGVPVRGAGAPYEMGSETISKWGQADLPVDATAIFPPTRVPSQYPPTTYAGATVHYLDPEGHQVNVASPSPPGVSGQSISTTETDMKGNVVRELSPRDRLLALESPESAARSHELDTHSTYNSNGTELLESWGPLHQVRLQGSGEAVQARRHTTTRYDEGEPTPPAGTSPAYLPTRETVGAIVPGREGELEAKTSETHYNWTLRKPEETVIDPGGLSIRSVTRYNAAGQVIETRQPKGAAGESAGDTRTYYYGESGGPSGCRNSVPSQIHLPCVVESVKQAKGTGRPALLAKQFLNFNELDEPIQILEGAEGAAGSLRLSTTEYGAAGRVKAVQTSGGGTAVPKSETVYSPTLLIPVKQQFVCEKECTGFNSRATTTTYNNLGQVVEYEDADGSKTKTTYDAYGRPATVTDEKGTDTFHYDEASGLLTSMQVSGVGTFTASYDADGDLISRGLPNGITEKTTYNAADEPTKLVDSKTSSCGESCTWYEESLERSIEGRVLNGTSSLVKDNYKYDQDGRLTEAQETPTGGQCTSRTYTFDADSNRLSKTTRTGVSGACATSGGTTQKYEYDEADRLMGSGITYDPWGRITNLPGEYAGGKELVTSYFSNDMVATQSQGGVTNSFQLDATGRQRQREQAGGVAGTEVFHYDGSGDSPAWTALGSTWSRNVAGIGGELAAIQESSGTTTFRLTDLHGDVVASTSSNPTATKPLGTYRFTEFGEPLSESAGRFGWLGGKGRKTELASGVIQMGRRSYIPSLGRFLTPDPVSGGSNNPYDYAGQDPINMFDLNGECKHPGHGKCLGPPSPKSLNRSVHSANKTRTVTLTFRNQRGAERFLRHLENAPNLVRSLENKIGAISAHFARELEAKASAVAKQEAIFGPPPPPPTSASSGNDCQDAGLGVGFGLFVVGAAPETGGASLVIGLIGAGVDTATTVAC